MAKVGSQRTFGRTKKETENEIPENPGIVDNEVSEQADNSQEEKEMQDTTATVETVETENTETANAAPVFDLDNLPSTGVEMMDNIAANVANRIRALRDIATVLEKNANLTNDSEVVNFAKSEDAPTDVKALFARYEEAQRELAESFENLKLSVLFAKGITPLSPEEVENKTAEFTTTREKALAGIDGLRNIAASFDDMPESVDSLIANLQSVLPVLPGQRKTSTATKADSGAAKPRLGNGHIKINGETVGKNIAPAVKLLNGKLPSGTPEVSMEEFISKWLSAARVSRWQDVPVGTPVTFDVHGIPVEIVFLPKNAG